MKPRFTFGQYVKCKAKCRTCWDAGHKNKTLVREEHSFSGWICGATRRFEGTYAPGQHYGGSYFSEEPPEYDPPLLIPNKSYFLWKVATSLMGKPLEVLDKDVNLSWKPKEYVPQAPLRLGAKWDENGWTREDQRKEMQNWPRDSNGRWKKKEKA